MSELFDQEMNAQKESLNNDFWGSRMLLQAHEKMYDKNERNKEKTASHVLMEGSTIQGAYKSLITKQ